MQHWTDPRRRGIYETTAHRPPYPQPSHQNDIAARVARMEVHLYHETTDRQRIEQESLSRARDIAGALTTIQDRLGILESHLGTAQTVAGWVPTVLKFSVAAIIFSLVLSGRMTVEGAKVFLPALGLPGG